MWTSEGEVQVTGRMETTPAMGVPSISVSQQQAPKKFAPVVAPKPKFNPYKDPTDLAGGDYPPPPPPAEDGGLSSSISFPPPPPMDREYQMHGPEKTLEERRSSLDAEIDSLTSILADLESNSPYKPHNAQNSGTLTSPNAPVTGYKRMVIPTQPPLTATKKSSPKAGAPGGTLPRPQAENSSSASILARPQFQMAPQPVPASYATASTPSQPTFNVQVRSAQPGPQHQSPGPPQQFSQQPNRSPVQYMAAQPRGPDFAYGPPQPGFAPQGYPEQAYPGAGGYGGEPGGYGGEPGGYGGEAGNTWRPQPSYAAAPTQQGCPQPVPKKTYITDPPASLAPPVHLAPQRAPSGARPEEELERLTKKMLYDMDNPPAEEYFGRCASCGDNVVGEGTGCTAMDQVFHVDCFICMTCSGRLRGKPFYAVEKKAYCEPCYINTLESCNICSKPIMERILRATGKAYHPHCFTCVVCQRSLDGIPFTVDAANHIHCIDDFHKKFAPRCCVCSEPIMPAPGQEETVRIVALDRDFHVQCYRCEDCGSLLSEGDNQGCYPLDGHVLCKSCNTSRIQALTAKATTDL
ncbi:lipoma-preferred partner isoform X1 [Oncorhynchus kisutch]|uniref:LIM domain containing preferred translocation partner in lipoma n=2 Tax=Oncorhynchus kisutch TaxID=8019 RepID=A0A8C7HVR4_ONCKI|nr:lipoma-preferred partner homolog isoform X1 [Oncorhynchus kisutch]XP_031678170.1 lipoma-preferred partner homolog isoform X1 [Oncorhynchus kisutch]